jgi:DNA-directed DNA polymerase III PolC
MLRGCRSPEEICRFARRQGLTAVGMADINNFYGLIDFLLAAGREGLRPVVGVVIEHAGRELLTAWVMSRRGYARVCGLLTTLLEAAAGPGIAGPSHRPPFDPLADLCRDGWEGLALASPHGDVLERLMAREPRGLYAKVQYGVPFAGTASRARALGVPLAAAQDAVFLSDADERLYPLLRAIDLNTSVERVTQREPLLSPSIHRYAGPEALARYFSAVPDALEGAARIAEEADASGIISPGFVFPGFDDLSDEGSFGLLRRHCMEGVSRRYGASRPDITKRLDYELTLIREKGFSSYFLVVRDIVMQCPRTCGRGSAASSIVSYLLGITHVDPLRYQLHFERFLNRGRRDPPDIAVDVPWDEREQTLRYVFKKYAGRCGMVATHLTFGPRSALRDPARAFGLPEEEIAELVRAFRQGRFDDVPASIRECAARLRGMPRNLGTHCGGLVITPGAITDYTHVQVSALGHPLIAWEKDAAEEAGLVKIDIRGNRSLSVLRDALALVERTGGGHLDWESFDPLEDEATAAMVAEGKTVGVFSVESPATRHLLARMHKGDYQSFLIASSIIRPAANRYIQAFVRRLHGEPWEPLHPLVADTLAETLGVMAYQEDVSRVAIDLAGFPIEDADCLRKILSKKDRDLKLPDYRGRFFRGARRRGVPEETIATAWDMILSFDGCSVCKAHSASSAQVSYRLAWLKRFHPLPLMASVINNGGGFYGRQTYLDEVRRMGFPLLPPDVNLSRWEYTVETAAGPDCGSPAALRVGLCQLKDTRREFVEAVLSERDRAGPYSGFGDFLRRTGCRFEDLRLFVRSGVLDSVAEGSTRPELFFRWQTMDREEGFGFREPAPRVIGDYPRRVKLADEAQTLGLVVSRHPLELFRTRISRLAERHRLSPLVSSAEIPGSRGKMVWTAGILVTGREVSTRNREPMVFVSFEDEGSIFETVLFPAAFQRYCALLDDGEAYLIHGRVDDDLGAIAITVERLVMISRRGGEPTGARGGAAGGGRGVARSLFGGYTARGTSPW